MPYEPFPAFKDWNIDFDPSVVNGYGERLRQAKASATPEAQQHALQVVTRYAAVDTGAIEGIYTTDRGFTETIATQSEFWQRALAQKGEKAQRSIEDALAGYDFVLDAVTGKVPVTEVWIRELHAVITARQETYDVYISVGEALQRDQRSLAHGEYKTYPNNPTSASTGREHHYAPPEDTPPEMTRLIDELKSPEFAQAHPVVQAAYAHYAYICIHPFADGNGRVARALASVYLYRHPGVPLMVFADQRDLYINALEKADEGQATAFVQFISERVVDAASLVIQSMTAPTAERSAVEELARHVASPARQLTLAAERLENMCRTQLDRVIKDMGLPKQVTIGRLGYAGPEYITTPPGYHPRRNGARRVSALVGNTMVDIHYAVFMADHPDEPGPELAVATNCGSVPVEVWLREIEPTESMTLRLKLAAWAEGTANILVQMLNNKLSDAAEAR
ncbi:MAG: Fic family protein [Propionibacteriaceae bacterium]|jgi:Fic family protein|nr:Fic family protein [Propionibacteriaceae bacterium]